MQNDVPQTAVLPLDGNLEPQTRRAFKVQNQYVIRETKSKKTKAYNITQHETT